MGSRAMAAHRSFEQQQRAESLWVVCEGVWVPAGSQLVAERIVHLFESDALCGDTHEIVRLNLRPINFTAAWEHWRANAWNHTFGLDTHDDSLSGLLCRGYPRDPECLSRAEQLVAMLERALEIARAHA